MRRHGAYGEALRRVRRYRGIPQDGLASVIGRAYISELERGRKSPTVRKVEELCEAFDTHPLTAYLLAFAQHPDDVDALLKHARREAKRILKNTDDRE